MNLLSEFRNDAAGAAIIKEWLGDGGSSVTQQRADGRVNICLNQCTEHRPERWWDFAKDAIADIIKKWLLTKAKTPLRLTREEEAGMCRICGCCLRLKAWTPIEHIKHHTPLETLDMYPSYCWVVSEAKGL